MKDASGAKIEAGDLVCYVSSLSTMKMYGIIVNIGPLNYVTAGISLADGNDDTLWAIWTRDVETAVESYLRAEDWMLCPVSKKGLLTMDFMANNHIIVWKSAEKINPRPSRMDMVLEEEWK